MGVQGQGFSKRNRPSQMTVNTEDVQKMQAGYEGRLAQQVQIINRLQDMLNGRTDQLAFQMQEENRRAAEWGAEPVNEIRVVDRPQIRYTEDDADAISQLWKLIPPSWDLYNEDDNQATALAGYIKWLQEEVVHHRGKESHWHEAFQGSEQARLAGERKLADVQAQLDEANRNLAQAITDARHNAKVANSKPTVVVMDDPDRPPWLEAGHVSPSSMIVPATMERHTPLQVLDPVRDGGSETIQFDGFGGSSMPQGEQRPGSF